MVPLIYNVCAVLTVANDSVYILEKGKLHNLRIVKQLNVLRF